MADLFARIRELLDVLGLQGARVIIVGQGMIGSPIAEKLARNAVGALALIDGKALRAENVSRHVLGVDRVGQNKAEGMAAHLEKTLSGSVQVVAVPHDLPANMRDAAARFVFTGADLIVAATDNRRVQRRINRIARMLGIPAIFAGVDPDTGRGEIIASFGDTPCFECSDAHRPADAAPRGVPGLNVDVSPTVDLTVQLCLGLLDRTSAQAQLFVSGRRDNPLYTVFWATAPRGDRPNRPTHRSMFARRRPDCPICGRPRQPRPPADGGQHRRPGGRPGEQPIVGQRGPQGPPRARPVPQFGRVGPARASPPARPREHPSPWGSHEGDSYRSRRSLELVGLVMAAFAMVAVVAALGYGGVRVVGLLHDKAAAAQNDLFGGKSGRSTTSAAPSPAPAPTSAPSPGPSAAQIELQARRLDIAAAIDAEVAQWDAVPRGVSCYGFQRQAMLTDVRQLASDYKSSLEDSRGQQAASIWLQNLQVERQTYEADPAAYRDWGQDCPVSDLSNNTLDAPEY